MSALSSDLLTSVSSATDESLRRIVGPGLRPQIVVPNGVDLEWFRPASPTEVATPIEPVFDAISIGRLVRYKRHVDIVRAASALRTRGWNGRIAIVGGGPEGPALSAEIRRCGLEGHVYLMGTVEDSKKRELLRSSRSYIVASEREGFSIGALEAMAVGVPVLAARPRTNDVFGVRDLVTPGVNGGFFGVGDTLALADALSAGIANREEWRRQGGNSRRLAEAYSWSRAVAKLERAFAEGIALKREGRESSG